MPYPLLYLFCPDAQRVTLCASGGNFFTHPPPSHRAMRVPCAMHVHCHRTVSKNPILAKSQAISARLGAMLLVREVVVPTRAIRECTMKRYLPSQLYWNRLRLSRTDAYPPSWDGPSAGSSICLQGHKGYPVRSPAEAPARGWEEA